MKKSKVLSAVVISGLALVALAGCGNGGKEEKKEETTKKGGKETKELVVSTFGISEEQVKEDVFKPFEKKHNVKIVVESGNSSERYTKLKSNPNSNVDVIELSQGNATSGFEEGLFEKIDNSKIKNMDKLIDNAKELAEDGSGPAYTINSVGIIYDKEAVGKELTDWADLWDDSLKGGMAIPDIATTFGPAMVNIANDYKKGDLKKDEGKKAFEGLKELAPNVVKTYSKSSDLANMFESGEIKAAIVGDFAVPMITAAHPNVEYFVPESGTYANFNTVNITKNSKNKELAQKYVDWRISKELEEVTSKSINEAPVNKEVELSDDLTKNMTYGKVAERAKVIDFKIVNKQMSSWIDEWNVTLNQ